MIQDAMPTEAQLASLVDAFYAKVRKDPALGALFNAAVDDWPEHLEKLGAFWSSVVLTTGRYKGNPMAAHLRQARAITPEMFDRWLSIWNETSTELLDGPGAALVQAKAARIAESLKLALFVRIERDGRQEAA